MLQKTMLKASTSQVSKLLGNNWSWLLMLAPVILLITKADYNYPIAVMAMIGGIRLLKQPRQTIMTGERKWLTVLFLLLWLPMLISMLDAVAPAHSANTVFSYLRFYFAGLFFIQELGRRETAEKFFTGLFIIISIWVIDAGIQLAFGKNLVGYPDNGKGITGLFYPKTRIGHVLAVFSPLYFACARTKIHSKPLMLILLIGLIAIVLLSGKRVAWLMLFASSAAMLGFVIINSGKKNLGTFSLAGLYTASLCTAVLSVAVLLYASAVAYPPLAKRIEKTSGLFSLGYQNIDRATSRRLSLWQISTHIAKENWLNGIGPRGFRHVAKDYAPKDNFWVQGERSGSTHPHQFTLEIVAETGLIGFIAYLCALILLIRLALYAPGENRRLFFAAFIACLVALLPLNSHMAFYGSYWSSVLWLLLFIFISQCSAKQP